jgi:exportin-T
MFASDVSRHPHPQVSLAYLNCAVRFPRFIDAHPETFGAVLQSFMDTRGIHHKHQLVRTRSCYLLKQLVRSVHGIYTTD